MRLIHRLYLLLGLPWACKSFAYGNGDGLLRSKGIQTSTRLPARTASTNDDVSTTTPLSTTPTPASQTILTWTNRDITSDASQSHSLSKRSARSATNNSSDAENGTTGGMSKSAKDMLPLTPAITPAISIAGVVLVLTGVVYTFLGIKNRRIQVFLSVAYLTSLSVAVLIVYVMNPPISNAVQAADFGAIFLTGIIVGAGSLVFIEVTEGLGCLLGGFCVSMWLLVLRPGGTIDSTGDKAGFILAFGFGAYALSFSHHTRPCGLIGATSFAGATAVILGVDCFSQAGLKEFWLYVWNLNSNLFAIDTTTYPITRGLRVETVVIILICILGVISQSRLWRVIKDRRDQRVTAQQEDERRRDAMEEVLGRQLESGMGRARAQWERVYGDHESGHRGNLIKSEVGIAISAVKGPSSVSSENEPSPTANTLQLKEWNAAETDSTNPHLLERHSTSTVRSTSDTRQTQSKAPSAISQPESTVRTNLAESELATAEKQPCPPLIPLPFAAPSIALTNDSSRQASNTTRSESDFIIEKSPSTPDKKVISIRSETIFGSWSRRRSDVTFGGNLRPPDPGS